jgi:hypothetical protein
MVAGGVGVGGMQNRKLPPAIGFLEEESTLRKGIKYTKRL